MYTSRVPKLTFQDFRNLKLIGENIEMTPSVLKKSYKALITKSKFWSYEKEWRLIINEKDEVRLSYDNIPFLSVESIYLGCQIEPEIKKSLVQFAEANKISIYVSKQSNERFILDFYHVSTKDLKDDEYYSKLYKYNRIEDENTKRRNIDLLNDMYENSE